MPKSSRKTSKKQGAKPAVTVKNLTVAFDSTVVLEDLTFDIQQGAITAIIGPNGSGKTTLIKTILGLIKPKSGEIKLFDQHIHDVRTSIGYVPQRFTFEKTFPITVGEFLALSEHAHSTQEQLDTKLKEVGLKSEILKKQLGSLSGGQLQRILIAQATLNDPSILVLDEPATGIDVIGEAAFYSIIKELNATHGTTVILVSHDISMVQASVDEVICVNKRLMCYGPPKSAMSASNLKKLFGENAHPYEHSHKHDH